jgi:AraC family transcriptional activator FtrA
MAAACNLSVRSFYREFVSVYGVTPKKFVQLKRIEKVRLLLRDPEVSVEEAIASVGVTDLPSFREVFRRELGISPAEYRRRLRA